MDFLVIAPPVCPPSEPPSGAFTLTSALCGHGFDAALLDLSLEFYHTHLRSDNPTPAVKRALCYLTQRTDGYDVHRHRAESGVLHQQLKHFSQAFPGWRLSAMDIVPPVSVHHPAALRDMLARGPDPFTDLWQRRLVNEIETHQPTHVVISLAYLSQLPATISLSEFLRTLGITAVVGGSLPRSLAATGHGLEILNRIFETLDISDGSDLISSSPMSGFLDRLHFPRLLSPLPYISARPVIPLPLSIGCFWRRCLFCPDRTLSFDRMDMNGIHTFLDSIPGPTRAAHPLVHLVDSAVPPATLRAFLPLASQHNIEFYGFMRPDKPMLKSNLLRDAAEAGCRMLQLGVESGSASLLDRFAKGIDPSDSAAVLRSAADAGIRTYVYLLLGLPGETDSDLSATADLLSRNATSVDFLNLSIFNLPQHCELTDLADAFHIETSDHTTDPDVIQLYRPFTVDGADPRRKARDFIQQSLLADPRIKDAWVRTPRWFRAAHLAIMNLPGRTHPRHSRCTHFETE